MIDENVKLEGAGRLGRRLNLQDNRSPVRGGAVELLGSPAGDHDVDRRIERNDGAAVA